MKLLSSLVSRGPGYLFRGLREGSPGIFLLGLALSVVRLGQRRKAPKPYSIKLKAGESIALRISKPGSAPVSYRVDA